MTALPELVSAPSKTAGYGAFPEMKSAVEVSPGEYLANWGYGLLPPGIRLTSFVHQRTANAARH
ncbi:hypothetical protein ACQPW1_24335 [Nocardia sp. CA-128927]|uniref:hypothetical protein n=1 Tax=Nocardia sp. CA-128927 TaxID=3239975 RepID=UPI003D99D2CE